MHPLRKMRRLHERGPDCRGLAVDEEGVALGPSCLLVQRTPSGYHRVGTPGIEVLARIAFGDDHLKDRLPSALDGIVAALAAGDLAKAQILGLLLPIDELDDGGLQRLRLAENLIKAGGYDPDEPRDDDGRWTADGASSTTATATVAATAAGAAEESPLFGAVSRATLSALSELGATLTLAAEGAATTAAASVASSVAFLGIIFIPTNNGIVLQGTLPDQPDITYRYERDTGNLTLYRDGQVVFTGRSGDDGVYRNSDGLGFGRRVDGSLVLDPDALPWATATAVGGKAPRDDRNAAVVTGAATAAGVAASRGIGTQTTTDTAREEPKLCPDPTPENIAGRKEPALAYQEQVTGLPRGLAVNLKDPATGKDVSFDGCQEITNGILMQDAKGPGYGKQMLDPDHWKEWYKGLKGMEDQLERQYSASRGTIPVEWDFAEKGPAEYFARHYQEKYPNFHFIYRPMVSP